MFKIILAIIPLMFFVQAQAVTPVQEAMIEDFNAIKYNMSIKYAPLEWKKEFMGWDLEAASTDAKSKIYDLQSTTSKDYQKILLSFLKSTRDYHVNVQFYSTEEAFFPLSIQKIDEKFFILSNHEDLGVHLQDLFQLEGSDSISNQQEYTTNASKLKNGDELIAIDNIPIKNALEEIIQQQFGGDLSDTCQTLATKSLFYKMGMYGEDVPSGTFQLTVRHMNTQELTTYTLPWIHFSEEIMNKAIPTASKSSTQNLIAKHLKRDFTVHRAEALLKNKHLKSKQAPQLGLCDGDYDELFDFRDKGNVPPLGEILWETSTQDRLYGYLYKTPEGKRIGYLYLSSFHYDDDAEDSLNAIVEVLQRFKRSTDALVIDITNNPGGNLLYTYGVLSALTDKPLSVPSQREILTQEDVYQALMLSEYMKDQQLFADLIPMDSLWGYPMNDHVYQSVINYCEKIVHAWEEGKTMTDPLYCYGIETLMPHPKLQYTKPLMVLINEVDFSCADFFPAIMQDNNRATIFGKKTGGAGGYIRFYPHSSRFGVMQYSLTGSLATRQSGALIENSGVTPDVPYELNLRDVTENYADYIDAVNREVSKMLK